MTDMLSMRQAEAHEISGTKGNSRPQLIHGPGPDPEAASTLGIVQRNESRHAGSFA